MRRFVGSAVLSCFFFATPVHAQDIREEVTNLFRFGNCGEPLCLNVDNEHGDHYIPASTEQSGQIIAFLSNAIGTSIASIPIGGASGGSTFSFENGLPVRSTVSAGPIFSDRAETIGRGRLLVGAYATLYRFETIRSVPLDGLRFVFTHANVGGAAYGDPIFENDIIQVDTDLDVQVSIAAAFITYGLTDRLDLGLAVPLVATSVSGRSEAQILPFGVTPHTFGASDQLTARASMSASATGVGDILLRGKANLGESTIGSIALLGQVRIPTGDEEQLLGSGSASFRVLGVVSGRFGDFSPHANGGIFVRGGEFERNAVLATVGFDHLLSPSVTLAADLLSTWEVGETALPLPAPRTFEEPFRRTLALTNIPDEADHSAYLAFGAKFSATESLTLVANTLAPIIRGGFQPAIAGTVGIEYNP